MQQVVNLAFHRPHFDWRIDQTRRPDDLLHHHTRRFGELIWPRRSRDVDHLVHAMFEFFKRERSVVEGRRQAEPVFDERFLARAIAVVHAMQLRHGLVRFVDEHQVIARKIIQQGRRWLAGQATGEMPRVVLDAVAVSDRLNHLEIEHCALVYSLRLHYAALFFQFHLPPGELFFDRLDGFVLGLLLHHIMGLRVDWKAHVLLLDRAEQWIDLREQFHLIAPQLDAISHVIVSGINFDDIAADAESATPELAVGALVENFDQLAGNVLAFDLLALL